MIDNTGNHLISRSFALLREWPLLALSDKAKFALKVALSLTIAYMLPMAMGWSQPSTAATTVMLIAATGGVRDSLMKGTLRIAGTVVGASIGLTLIALFAQDRLLYLLSASLLASLTLYLYKAYQGDGTLFMLAAVSMLMVFNGGDAEGAFLYGVDRAFMTTFGVVVYTLVGSFVWPVHAKQNLAEQTLTTIKLDRDLFVHLYNHATEPRAESAPNRKATIKQLSGAQGALREQWLKVHNEDPDVKAWDTEWQYLLHYQVQLAQELAAAQEPAARDTMDYRAHIPHYENLLKHIENRFAALIAQWDPDKPVPSAAQPPSQPDFFTPIDRNPWRQLPHMQQAQLNARVQSLHAIDQLLQELIAISDCLQKRILRNTPQPTNLTRESAFVPLDADNAKTAIQVFATFWFTTLVWILLNPPGGYLFVALSSALIVLVSFTPVQPKLLYILFTFGFVCALPCYIFILPQLSRSYELALFLFAYTAFAHYLFPSPVNIFFMFGLFTMGIDNNMAYHLDVVLSIMLMFYLVITALLITTRFVFPGKPEYLFALMRKRLFRHMAQALALRSADSSMRWPRIKRHFYQQSMARTLPKMRLWASQIDASYFHGTAQEALTDYVDACAVACFRANTVITAAALDADNPLLIASRRKFGSSALSSAALALATDDSHTLTGYDNRFTSLKQGMDRLLDERMPTAKDDAERSRFYVNLNLMLLLWDSYRDCEHTAHKINWLELKQSRF